MDELVTAWQHEGRIITFRWVGDEPSPLSRVYALAFTETGEMLLVGDDTGTFWLPGGGVEAGETPDEALVRELLEEAAATLEASSYIGAQRVEDPCIRPSITASTGAAPTLQTTMRPRSRSQNVCWCRQNSLSTRSFGGGVTRRQRCCSRRL